MAADQNVVFGMAAITAEALYERPTPVPGGNIIGRRACLNACSELHPPHAVL
jgi:hypothetical protein